MLYFVVSDIFFIDASVASFLKVFESSNRTGSITQRLEILNSALKFLCNNDSRTEEMPNQTDVNRGKLRILYCSDLMVSCFYTDTGSRWKQTEPSPSHPPPQKHPPLPCLQGHPGSAVLCHPQHQVMKSGVGQGNFCFLFVGYEPNFSKVAN